MADALAARGVPFVFSTGYDSVPENYASVPQLGKPYRREQLELTLRGVLRPKVGSQSLHP